MPEASLPPHVDYTFDARYRVGDDGAIVLPTSRRMLVIQRLDVVPPARSESFADGVRALHFAPGTDVRVQGALRAYALADGTTPTLADLLPGAELSR